MTRSSIAGRSPVDIESRYEFLEKIGSGSFATVYRARDNELGREVAVKRIHEEFMAETAKLEQFWAEAQLLASLQHPNIVTIYDLYKDRGWLILELMQTNLADRMQGRPMDVRAAKTTVAHCLRALKYLHDRGIIHGDVKPSNMMIDARKRIKIGDFGLARRASDEEGSLLKGTTKYMAPEVVSDEFGEIGPASDLYSLGFSAYQLLCGENFEQLFPGLSAFGRNKQVAWMMWHAAPDRRVPEIGRVLQGVPEDLAGVVDKLVKKPQTERYATAQQALDDLEVDQKIVREVKDGRPQSEHDAGRRKRLLLLGGALLFSVVLSAVVLFMPTGGDDPTKSAPDVVVFREFFPDANEIKVTPVDGDRATTIKFDDDPAIVLKRLGEPDETILLRELAAGDRLEFDRTGDRLEIVASRPVETVGVILELDTSQAEPRLVLAPRAGPFKGDLELRVPEGAPIVRNGQTARLEDLEVDAEIKVYHLNELGNKPGRVAARIEATQPEPDAVGVIESLDADKRTLVVREDDATLDLVVADDATITLRNRDVVSDVPLGDLKPGDSVTAKRDEFVREILAVRDTHEAAGVVVGVAPGLDLVTIQPPDGDPLQLLVGGTTDIRIGSTPARLADLRRDDEVRAKYGENDPGALQNGKTRSASSLYVTRPKRADRWAIVVATARYSGGVVQLPFALADARDLALVFRERYSVMDDRCILLENATRSQIEARFDEELKKVGAGSELIVYLGGHAFVQDGTVYLGGTDLDTGRVAATGLPLTWIVDRIDASQAASKLVLLDTCHAGSDAKTQPATEEQAHLLPDRDVPILASCSRGERAYASAERRHGLFVHALTEGYAGGADADVNHDRDVAVNVAPSEIETFTRSRLASSAPRQTPVLVPPE